MYLATGYNCFSFTLLSSLNSEIRRCAQILGEPLMLGGKEVVFSDGEGFEPLNLEHQKRMLYPVCQPDMDKDLNTYIVRCIR